MKRVVALLLVVVLCLGCLGVAGAHDCNNGHINHDQWLEESLFGKKYTGDNRDKLDYLENASYVTIDLCNNAAKESNKQYQNLKNFGIFGFPSTIKEINSPGGGSAHRQYTHLGWNKKYETTTNKSGITWSAKKFTIRKKILTATVDKIFDFQPLIPNSIKYYIGYSKQCESFAELVYYIHLLGDHREMQSFKDFNDNYVYLLELANDGEAKEHCAVIPSIIYCLEGIVTDKKSDDYKKLMNKLHKLNAEASYLSYHRRSTLTDGQFDLYKEHVLDVFSALKEHLPPILKKEPFFKKVFYP